MRSAMQINCMNIAMKLNAKEEMPGFCLIHQTNRYRFEFDDAEHPTMNQIMDYMNRYWVRSDFYSRYELQDTIGKGGFASVDRILTAGQPSETQRWRASHGC
jgi:hypothetical protein